jgi:orotate phosphoribosyltransferase
MEIIFDKKFTQKDLDTYIEKYYVNSLKELNVTIEFNLERLEWISSEEITFLFAWLRQLSIMDKNLSIRLPLSSNKFEDDSEDIIERRKFIKFYIWSVWRMFDLKIENYNFYNHDDINKLIEEKEGYNYGKKILPFQIINTEIDSDEAVDKKFYSNTKGQFNIDKDITQLLNENNCYSPFENKVISDIITKELFMNSTEHAQTNECYFTTALRDKWDNINNQYFLNQFIKEKDDATLDFYKDKEALVKVVKANVIRTKESTIKNISEEGKNRKIIINLSRKDKNGNFIKPEYNDNKSFKNKSSLEFTFIDFGTGIYSTLEEEYLKNKEKSIFLLSDSIENKHLHSQILEYAFLLDSSKDPFDNRIERTDLIPRGLYFLIDMVRRYKGLLVARSGYGKVVYDFSDRIVIELKDKDELSIYKERCYLIKDAVVPNKNNTTFFSGTMISIVLPEREIGKFRKAGVRIDDYKLNEIIFNRDQSNDYFPKQTFGPQYYEYLPLAFLYQVSDLQNIYQKETQSSLTEKNAIINSAFISINNKLKEMNAKVDPGVVFIDFDNLPKRNYVYKILNYLSNSPLVNEKVKVVAVNIEDDELNILKEYERGSEFTKDTSFLFKAIPCIKLTKYLNQKIKLNEINWLGVPDKENEYILTGLLTGKIENIHISKIEDKYKYLYEGNVITQSNDGWVTSIFTTIDDLITKANSDKLLSNNLEVNLEKLKTDIINEILEWINEEVIIDGTKNKELFLATNGAYQTKYLSFYNRLIDDSIAEFFAKFLLDKYIDIQIANYESKENISFDTLSDVKQMDIKRTFKFDKILAVTVSSQFLAIQLRNLIWKNETYSFLIKKEKNTEEWISLEDCPDLIKVSSYFSFEEEKPFKDIKENQSILIINDVISSGSLIERLVKGIESRKSNIKGILSIIDTRREIDDKNEEFPSKFFDSVLENKIISIISSKHNADFIIKKLRNKPKGTETYKIRRINPILNAVVTLNSKHSEKERVLIENQELKDIELDESIFQIGHFKQSSLSCSGFYTDMHKLFHNDKGKKLLKELKGRMDKGLMKIGQQKCEPYFIFQPVYSAIEEISKATYFSVFNSKDNNGQNKLAKYNIISLQRYETPYGWRFVFPAKRYNEILKGKDILIIDSGTLSGQSLIQLIDAVSIYEVNRIDVLTAIGRLDDFQREFYSRLESLKVKTLGDEERRVSAALNVFFGINLHIPPFHTEDKCPFCKEIKSLEKYLNDYSDKMPKESENYIKNRLKEIEKKENNNNKITTHYIPIDRNGKYDFENIFLMRDLLGKIDGYRFYEDYFDEIDTLCGRYPNKGQELFENNELFEENKKNDLKQFEQILICILHETNILSCIKNLIKNLYDILEYLIRKVIYDESIIDKLNYNWSKYSLLRIYYTLSDKKEFNTLKNFELVFRFCKNDANAHEYFSFILWEGFSNLKDDLFVKESITSILLKMNDMLDESDRQGIYSNTKIGNIIKSIVHRFEITPIRSVNDAFFNLRKFFIIQKSSVFHSELHRDIGRLMTIVENKDLSNDEINTILNLFENIIKNLDRSLWQNLYKIKDCVENGDRMEYEKLFLENDSICKSYERIRIKYLEISDNSERQTISEMKILTKDIEEFQTKFLLENTIFAGFCKRYKANLKYCIDTAQKGQKVFKKIKSNNIQIEEFTAIDILVNGHSDLLTHAFEEIFYNAAKCEHNVNAKINFFVKAKEDSIVELTIFQNKPFIDSHRKSGINNTILPIFQSFCGSEGIRFIENNDNFQIVITFNTDKLQNN